MPKFKIKKRCQKGTARCYLLQIQLRRQVDLIRNVLSVFLALTDALSKEIFDLTVDGAKVVLCPRGNGGIPLWRHTEGDLLLALLVHLNTGYPN